MSYFHSIKTNHPLWPGCRVIGWYLFWLAAILCIYRSGLLMFPKKDHLFFMLGRQLFENDLVWFFKTLSYNRTRVIFPGDYFAFRPVLMAILGLEDIFLRHQLQILGLVGCGLFSFTATVLFFLTRRLAGLLPALLLTLIWSANLAGAEMLLWQHITAYVLAPGFLFLALLLVTEQAPSVRRQLSAAGLVLAAGLTHEICVIVSGAFAVFLFIICRAGAQCRRQLVVVFLLPAILALTLNALDFLFINPPPSLRGSADIVPIQSTASLLSSLWAYWGAIGVAVFAPWAVDITVLPDWSHVWLFSDRPPALSVASGLVLILGIGTGAWQVYRQAKRDQGWNIASLAATMLLLFFFTSFAVCLFRFVTRGITYLQEATYYFPFFVFSICGLLSVISATITKVTAKWGLMVILAILAFFHLAATHSLLKTGEGDRRDIAAVFDQVRGALEYQPQYCFAGFDTTYLPDIFSHWTPLFHDISCSLRPNAEPLYLSRRGNSLMLSKLAISSPQVPYRDMLPAASGKPFVTNEFATELMYGAPFKITLTNTPAFKLMISGPYTHQSFHVSHNLISIIGQKRQYSSLPFHPGRKKVTYRVEFTDLEVMFWANELLVSRLPKDEQMLNAPVRVILMADQAFGPLQLQTFSAATQPATQELRQLPAFRQ